MKALIKNALIYISDSEEFRKGELLILGDRILQLGDNIAETADTVIDADRALVIPGFVDVHTHGRAGYDFCSADNNGLSALKKSYLECGTTSLMPTLASAPYSDLISAIDRINEVKSNDPCGAEFLGIHLEGRYLNPIKRGAHAEDLLAPFDKNETEELIERMGLPCHITSALELDGGDEFAKRAVSLGATLGLGHTEANYSQAIEYLNKYGISFSHLFNAMPPLLHRDGGAVCAGLTGNGYCEIICDGLHISPEMIRMSYACLTNKRLALITDSMEASGCPDGRYSIAGNACDVVDGRALTLEGKLAGSTLNMKLALENLMKFCDIPLSEALPCATLTPAKLVGVSDTVGSLEIGKRADILLVRESAESKIRIEKIICGGKVYA